MVTSLAEVWIEICIGGKRWISGESLPLRKCGLKSPQDYFDTIIIDVTSLAEVWIEICIC